MSAKFVNLLKPLYSKFCGCVRVYDSLLPEFTTRKGVRKGCTISSFFFDFVMHSFLEATIYQAPLSSVKLLPGGMISNLKYADDVLLSEDSGRLQKSSCGLYRSTSMFKMCLVPLKCKMMLQDRFLLL